MKPILCVLTFLTSVTFCQASPIDFANLIGQTVSLTVEPYASGENNGSYYVGLTQGYINNDPSQSIWMFCNDAFNQITTPTTYAVKVVGLANNEFAGDTLGLSLAQLQQQATLGREFGATPSGNNQADADTQQDIWNYTGGSYKPDAGMLADTAEMNATYKTANYSQSFLLDATSEPGEQAFMPVASSSATPEPMSLVLLGSGLLALGLFGRQRRASR